MPLHLANHLRIGGHVPGILILRPQSEVDQVVEDLALIAAAAHRTSHFLDSITQCFSLATNSKASARPFVG